MFILVILLRSNYATAECNVCQSNQAACINSTSFYLCFGGKPTQLLATSLSLSLCLPTSGQTKSPFVVHHVLLSDDVPNLDKLYHCKDGFECTDLNAICVQSSSQRRPSCGDTSLCGMCSAHRNHVFACLSRTTFQMCYGAIRPIGQIGHCPQGLVCDATSDAVCVQEELVDTVTCDVLAEDDGNTSGGSGNEGGGSEGGDDTTSTSATSSSTPATTASTSGNEGSGGGGGAGGEESTTAQPNGELTPQQVCEQMTEVGLYPTSPMDPYCKRYGLEKFSKCFSIELFDDKHFNFQIHSLLQGKWCNASCRIQLFIGYLLSHSNGTMRLK